MWLTGPVVRRAGGYLDAPGVLAHAVGDARVDTANHAQGGVGGVRDGEGDGLGGERRDIPVAERPVVGAAVQRVAAVVVLRDVLLAVERVFRLANAVGVSAGN